MEKTYTTEQIEEIYNLQREIDDVAYNNLVFESFEEKMFRLKNAIDVQLPKLKELVSGDNYFPNLLKINELEMLLSYNVRNYGKEKVESAAKEYESQRESEEIVVAI